MNEKFNFYLSNVTNACFMLDDIPQINSGGCGISSLSIYRWIEKFEPDILATYNVKFCIISGSTYETTNNSIWFNAYKNENYVDLEYIIIPDHIAVAIDNIIIDSTGIIQILPDDFNSDTFENLFFFEDVDYLLLLINDVPRWNSSFRRRYVHEIAKNLEINLSDINTGFFY